MQITRTEQLSTLIKAYRKKHGITQTVISHLVGLHVATTSDSENQGEITSGHLITTLIPASNTASR